MSLFALTLVLIAAFTHASWNLLAKRAGGGVTFVWMAAVAGAAIFLPLCFLFGVFGQVAWNRQTVLFLLGSGILQLLYFVTLQRGYQVGDLSLVYPLARGTGPFFATLAAVFLLGERPTPLAFAGACMIVGGVFAMTFTAPRTGMHRRAAILFGLATGLCIACYTLWDKIAVSTILIPPLLLDTSTVLLRAVVLAPVALRNRPTVARLWQEHKWAVVGVGLLSELAYLLVLIAMQTTPVSYVAPAREISILIGTVMGARLLAEGHLRPRLVAASAIVVGVVALAFG